MGNHIKVKSKKGQTIPIYNFQNKKEETQIFALFWTSNIEAFKNEDLSSLRRIYINILGEVLSLKHAAREDFLIIL